MKFQAVRKPIVISLAVIFHVFLVFHLLFSPVIIIFAASEGLVNASFISFAAIFVLSLFAGRAYCAWFCPGCGVQEILSLFVNKKAPNTKARLIKYAIFALWFGTITVLYLLNGIRGVDLGLGMNDISVQRRLFLTLGAAAIIVPLALAFGLFASCKYVCWQAPLMVIGTRMRDVLRLPGLRIRVDKSKCTDCGVCAEKCPMDLNPLSGVREGQHPDPECILCGSCIDSCDRQALSYSFSTRMNNKLGRIS